MFRFDSGGILCRCLFGSGKHVLDGGSELVRSGARDDDRISPAMGFLGNAKESSPIVFTEFHVEMLPFDVDLLRFDNIVHFGGESDRMTAVGKQKIRLNLTTQKANIRPPGSSSATFAPWTLQTRSQISDCKINLSLKLIYPSDMYA